MQAVQISVHVELQVILRLLPLSCDQSDQKIRIENPQSMDGSDRARSEQRSCNVERETYRVESLLMRMHPVDIDYQAARTVSHGIVQAVRVGGIADRSFCWPRGGRAGHEAEFGHVLAVERESCSRRRKGERVRRRTGWRTILTGLVNGCIWIGRAFDHLMRSHDLRVQTRVLHHFKFVCEAWIH